MALSRATDLFLDGQVATTTMQTLEARLNDPQILQARLDDPVKQVNEGLLSGLVLGTPEFQQRTDATMREAETQGSKEAGTESGHEYFSAIFSEGRRDRDARHGVVAVVFAARRGGERVAEQEEDGRALSARRDGRAERGGAVCRAQLLHFAADDRDSSARKAGAWMRRSISMVSSGCIRASSRCSRSFRMASWRSCRRSARPIPRARTSTRRISWSRARPE